MACNMRTTLNINNISRMLEVPLHASRGFGPVIVALVFSATPAAAQPDQGLILTTALESEVEYDSDIRARDEGRADTSIHIRGTVQSAWRIGPGHLQARLGGDIRRFDKEKGFDQEALILGIDLSPSTAFRNSRLTLSGKASYDSTTRSDPILGDYIQAEQIEVGATLEYDPNSRVVLSIAPSYYKQFPEARAYGDQTVRSLNLESRFRMGRATDLTVSLDARESRISGHGAPDTESFTVQAGWRRGQDASFSWSLNAGLQSWKRAAGKSRENPFVAARIHWRLNDTSALSAQVDHGLQVYLDNSVNEGSRLSVSLSRDFNQDWKGRVSSVVAKDRLERLTAPDRDDEWLSLTLEIEKVLNRRSSASLFVEVSDRDSTEDLFSYGRLKSGIRWFVLW